MEAPETRLKLKYVQVIHTTVKKVEKLNNLWYTNFQGSWESIAFPGDEPPFATGDVVKITFEKVNDDQPQQSSEQ